LSWRRYTAARRACKTHSSSESLTEEIMRLQREAYERLGPVYPDFDVKAFRDVMWKG
jgi:hypothetical protein